MRSTPEMKWNSDPLAIQGRIEGLEYLCKALFSIHAHFTSDTNRALLAQALEELSDELVKKSSSDSRITNATVETIRQVTEAIRSAK